MERIPADIEAAVRAAAQARPGYGGELADVRRRVRRRRRRTVVVAFTGVVLTLTVAGTALHRPVRPEPPAAPAPAVPGSSVPADDREPAQRLFLRGAHGTYQGVRLGGDTQIGELGRDGTIRTHPVTGADGWDWVRDLADGTIVALGSRDTTPGVERPDGPDVTGVEFNLVVVGPDGEVRLERDVRRRGEAVILQGATAERAYLWRPAGLVEHDLATGRERTVMTAGELGLGNVFDGSTATSDMAAGRLAIGAADGCDVTVHEVTGPGGSFMRFPGQGDCTHISGLRLSPDASALAVVYSGGHPEGGQRVAVVDVASGAVLADRHVDGTEGRKDGEIVTVSWRDARVVRGAAYPVGDGSYDITPFEMTW